MQKLIVQFATGRDGFVKITLTSRGTMGMQHAATVRAGLACHASAIRFMFPAGPSSQKLMDSKEPELPKPGRKRNKKPTVQNPSMETGQVEVDDPLEQGAKLLAFRRLSDFISREHASRRIDDAQKAAADEFYKLRVKTMSNGLSSPSFAREYVDSSGRGDPITDRFILACKRLNQARSVIGITDYEILNQCIVEGLSPSAMHTNDTERRISASRIRKALEMLAVYWGYASDPASQARRVLIEKHVGSDFELVVNVVEG